jgi:sulfite exporter TauE/SafE
MGYGMLFIVGLFTSLHCIAMCGGINVSQTMTSSNNSTKSKLSTLKPSFLYNSGRVVSYTILGGIVGAIGSVFSLTGYLKGIVSICAGIFMIIMGLKLLNIFPSLRKFNIKMPKLNWKVASKFPKGPFFVGLLNGLMPCGPLQSIQLYALGTGNALEGALSMFFFSLGTFPLMFLIGLISSYLGKAFQKNVLKFGATLVMVLGVVMLNRGLSLSGVNTNFLNIGRGVQVASVVEDGVQIVRSGIESGSYSTVKVKKGIPVKWIITIEEGKLNGCNNPIVFPKYDMEHELHIGENIIEFTPTEDGRFVYTCWMGMIKGEIVVES